MTVTTDRTPHGTITRSALRAALDRTTAGPLVAEMVHAHPVPRSDGGQVGETCLAITYDLVADLAVLLAAIGDVLGPDFAAFAARTKSTWTGLQATTYWPGYTFDEETREIRLQ